MKMKEKNERVTSKGMMERKLNEIRMRQQRKLDRIIEEIHERFSWKYLLSVRLFITFICKYIL